MQFFYCVRNRTAAWTSHSSHRHGRVEREVSIVERRLFNVQVLQELILTTAQLKICHHLHAKDDHE